MILKRAASRKELTKFTTERYLSSILLNYLILLLVVKCSIKRKEMIIFITSPFNSVKQE